MYSYFLCKTVIKQYSPVIICNNTYFYDMKHTKYLQATYFLMKWIFIYLCALNLSTFINKFLAFLHFSSFYICYFTSLMSFANLKLFKLYTRTLFIGREININWIHFFLIDKEKDLILLKVLITFMSLLSLIKSNLVSLLKYKFLKNSWVL